MERLKMDRKKRRKKRNKHVSYKWRGGGVFGGGGGGYTVMYIKMLKVKQKADYQRHVFHCSNQAVRQ